jgi:hypothetical protein
MNVIRLKFLFFAAAILCTVGCSRKASEEIDFGTIQDSVYHNDYFGLSVTVPADWSVQDQ